MDSQQETMEFQVFKGLQRPLEFLGLQGRYIVWAAIAAVCGVIGFIMMFILVGFLAAIILFTCIAGFTLVMIMLKRSKGLHSKKEDKGVFVFARTINRL